MDCALLVRFLETYIYRIIAGGAAINVVLLALNMLTDVAHDFTLHMFFPAVAAFTLFVYAAVFFTVARGCGPMSAAKPDSARTGRSVDMDAGGTERGKCAI